VRNHHGLDRTLPGVELETVVLALGGGPGERERHSDLQRGGLAENGGELRLIRAFGDRRSPVRGSTVVPTGRTLVATKHGVALRSGSPWLLAG